MPHTTTHWREMVALVSQQAAAERLAAREWKAVADARLAYLSSFDASLDLVIRRANAIVQIFDVESPKAAFPVLPPGASGEERARSCREKLAALTHFSEKLAAEALQVERTLRDVFQLATEAVTTSRPTSDVVSTTLAQEIERDFGEIADYYDASSPVTNQDPSFQEKTETPPILEETPDASADLFALMKV